MTKIIITEIVSTSQNEKQSNIDEESTLSRVLIDQERERNEKEYRVSIRNKALNDFKQKYPQGVKMRSGAEFLK